MAALNPVLPDRLQIEESLAAHSRLHGRAARARAAELLGPGRHPGCEPPARRVSA